MMLMLLATLQTDPAELDALQVALENEGAARKAAEREVLLLLGGLRPERQNAHRLLAAELRLKHQSIRLDVRSQPLPSVIGQLRDWSGIAIELDSGAGIRWPDELVTFKVVGVPLGNTLKLLLGVRGLTYVELADGRLVITKPSRVDEVGERGNLGDLVGYIDSFRSEVDPKRIEALLRELDDEEIEVRDRAERALLQTGRSGLRALEKADLRGEAGVRLRKIRGRLGRLEADVAAAGLDHDVPFFARIDDPRAHARLKAIAGDLRPFAKDGFPDRGPGFAEYLAGWWAWARDGVRWNAEKDRFEPK